MSKYLLPLALLATGVAGSTPEPDTSAECLDCQAQMTSMYETWTNETTVAEILAELQDGCKAYPLVKREVCDKLAEVFVQIPPGLFEGMESLAWPVPLATCATVRKCHVNCCASNSPPEQVHISLSSRDRSVYGVTWVTLAHTSSVVQYGLTPKHLNKQNEGSMDTYTAGGWVGTIHRARMTGLLPATTYYYRVGSTTDTSEDTTAWSEVFSFTTMDPRKESLTFAMIGDMDFDTAGKPTVDALKTLVTAGKVDVIVHSGDVSYADGYEPHWDDFLNEVQPIATKIPYMVTPGNHEFWYNFTSYKHRFYMPGTDLDVEDEGGDNSTSIGMGASLIGGSGSGDSMYYSWNAGYAHFLSCNSETPIDTANFKNSHVEWMVKDLKRTNLSRDRTPWVIANFHRPMYCQDRDDTCVRQANVLKTKAERVFYENQVNFVVAGHVHAYERTYPVYQDEVVSQSYSVNPYTAPVHLLQGASGNREGNKGSYPPPEERKPWSAEALTNVGYALMTVSEHEAEWTFYDSVSGEVLDHALYTR